MAANSYSFEYQDKQYRWDRNTLRSREGRAEIMRVLGARLHELRHEGHSKLYPDITTARNVLEALSGDLSEQVLRAIEEEISEKLGASDETAQTEQEVEMAQTPDVDIERVREMNRISADPEGRQALQRARIGQDLDAKQKAMVQRYQELETAHNEQARHEQRSPGGTMKISLRPALGADVLAWAANPHKEQRRQLSADWRNRTLANPEHDYWHPERGALNKSAKLAMKAAYEMAETGECTSVSINPTDGSISDNPGE